MDFPRKNWIFETQTSFPKGEQFYLLDSMWKNIYNFDLFRLALYQKRIFRFNFVCFDQVFAFEIARVILKKAKISLKLYNEIFFLTLQLGKC